MLCQSLSNTLFTAMLATGNIRNYQIIVGGLALMAFPLSYGLFKMGFEPAYCYYATIFISILCLVVRLIMLHRIIGLSIRIFFKDVIVRVILVSIFSLISLIKFILDICYKKRAFILKHSTEKYKDTCSYQ